MANLEDGLSKPILKRTGGKLPTHLEPTYRGEGGVHARKQGDRVRHFATATALVLWLGAVAVGMVMLWQYSMSPGTPAKAPPTWPAQSKIPLSRDKLNLVMAVHPRCPCSRASIGEVAVLMARTGSRIAASVIFVRSSGLWLSAVCQSFTHRGHSSAMPEVKEPNGSPTLRDRAEVLYQEMRRGIFRRTDRLFAGLMVFQWLGGILAAFWLSPLTWAGE